MKILLHEEIKLERKDILTRVRPNVESTAQPPREGGVHLSGVLKEWATSTQILTPGEYDEDEGMLPLRMFMGLCVEWGISRLYPETSWWPGTIARDGVVGSPDGMTIETKWMPIRPHIDNPREGENIIEEIKYTHMSCANGRDVPALNDRQNIKDWWRRLQQAMGYCNLHPARPRLARFHVIYGVGDYIRPYQEKYLRTLIEFNPQELAANWEMIQKYRKRTKAEGTKGA